MLPHLLVTLPKLPAPLEAGINVFVLNFATTAAPVPVLTLKLIVLPTWLVMLAWSPPVICNF